MDINITEQAKQGIKEYFENGEEDKYDVDLCKNCQENERRKRSAYCQECADEYNNNK